ncbi:hypothetical protein [Leptospira barantonii]|uniref:Uncharacterized protein n=1 Tax=Leptospira barantonii TaxID=2023184 RepID=A0ABX4NKF7_9LEPT|nr:hypothetical protein [Leptospira barantonii]PJZ57240.1 hypothetical protein CH367_10945 [Leptospira barantonii]
MEKEEKMEIVIVAMRKRALRARRFAQILIALIVIVVAFMLSFFFTSAQTLPTADVAKSTEIKLLFFDYKFNENFLGSTNKEDFSTDTAVEKSAVELLKGENSRLKEEASQRAFMINTIGSAILRIGSVFLAVYLLQILVHITRYHFRIADHLEAICDSILITEATNSELKEVFDILSSKEITFGPTPSPVSDRAVELVKGTINKISGK